MLSFYFLLLATVTALPLPNSESSNEATILSGSLMPVPVHNTNGDGEDSSSHRTKRNTARRFRLYRGEGSKPIDMDLDTQSIWNSKSTFSVRKKNKVRKVNIAEDPNCILSGRVTSVDEGYASINACGRLMGEIDIGDKSIEIDSKYTPKQDGSPNKVTIQEFEDNGNLFIDEEEEMMADEETEEEENQAGDRKKRETSPFLIEVGIFIEPGYVTALKRKKIYTGLDSEIRDFMLYKWSRIKDIFNNATVTGAEIDIQVKSIEVWEESPEYITDMDETTFGRLGPRLRSFCQNSPDEPNYDLKVLYTMAPSKNFKGQAYTNSICKKRFKCMIVKFTKKLAVLESHELGHLFGLRHEFAMSDCSKPYGFMGGAKSFRECYKDDVLATLAKNFAQCLREENV